MHISTKGKIDEILHSIHRNINTVHIFHSGLRRISSSKLGTGRTADQVLRPGLSAGISGAGYAEDGQSITSSMMSSVAIAPEASQTEARESPR